MKKVFIAFVLALLVVACTKECPTRNMKIENYTATDALGNIIGTADADDWGKKSLSSDELAYFSFADTADYSATDSGGVSVKPVFPNPVDSVASFEINTEKVNILDYVLVDEKALPQGRGSLRTLAGYNKFRVDLRDRNRYPSGKLLRFYYRCSSNNRKGFFTGYGDVKIK